MSLLDLLDKRECWEAFFTYKSSLCLPKVFTKELRGFIDREAYLPAVSSILSSEPFPLPKRSVISKQYSQKKRVVYTYPPAENHVLKLLTYLCLRRYDHLFDPGLYSFRPGISAKDAIYRLSHTKGIWSKYAYKADIHNYFNSIPIEKLLPILREALSDDPRLYAFFESLLSEKRVIENGTAVEDVKGIMAGTPPSAFFANLYLKDLDHHFNEVGIPYARYSDDILVLADSPEELAEHIRYIHAFLKQYGLEINPDKEAITSPDEGWVFLGFYACKGRIDIAPANVQKLKDKMRRKTRALARWQKRNALEGEKAAKAFIRIFNRKLLETSGDNELSWAYWFFPSITTVDSLKVIDRYAQDQIRYLLQGTRGKARFRASYSTMKDLGYRSLVHAYYEFKEGKAF